jgi:hypothetical protein
MSHNGNGTNAAGDQEEKERICNWEFDNPNSPKDDFTKSVNYLTDNLADYKLKPTSLVILFCLYGKSFGYTKNFKRSASNIARICKINVDGVEVFINEIVLKGFFVDTGKHIFPTPSLAVQYHKDIILKESKAIKEKKEKEIGMTEILFVNSLKDKFERIRKNNWDKIRAFYLFHGLDIKDLGKILYSKYFLKKEKIKFSEIILTLQNFYDVYHNDKIELDRSVNPAVYITAFFSKKLDLLGSEWEYGMPSFENLMSDDRTMSSERISEFSKNIINPLLDGDSMPF